MILLDTPPLVALCDPSDGLNRTALRDLDRLAREPMVTCSPVLTEACVLLPRAAQRRRLRRFLVDFSTTAYRIDDDAGLWLDVLDWLGRYEEHEPDWADAYLAVLSGRERRFRISTYDRELRTIWRRADGSRIPLALG